MENIFSNNSPEILIAILFNFFLIIILFIMNLSSRSKLKKLKAKYSKFMSGLSSDNNIEEMLEEYLIKVNEVESKRREMEKQINHLERNQVQCVQRVGVVRFSAFDNVGSDLSFTIALLDNNDDGVLISGIYSRDSSATYAKPVVAGKSKYAMSSEKIQAVDIARRYYR